MQAVHFHCCIVFCGVEIIVLVNIEVVNLFTNHATVNILVTQLLEYIYEFLCSVFQPCLTLTQRNSIL